MKWALNMIVWGLNPKSANFGGDQAGGLAFNVGMNARIHLWENYSLKLSAEYVTSTRMSFDPFYDEILATTTGIDTEVSRPFYDPYLQYVAIWNYHVGITYDFGR